MLCSARPIARIIRPNWAFASKVRRRQIRTARKDVIFVFRQIRNNLIWQTQSVFDDLRRRQAQPLSHGDI